MPLLLLLVFIVAMAVPAGHAGGVDYGAFFDGSRPYFSKEAKPVTGAFAGLRNQLTKWKPAPKRKRTKTPRLAAGPVRGQSPRLFRSWDGTLLRYDFRHPRPGAPIVLYVHGIGDRTQVGIGLDDRVPEPFGVAAIERRGHGAGQGIPAVEDVVTENARDLRALIAHLNQQPETNGSPLILVGHSMGTDIILRALELYPEDEDLKMLKEIILLNPPGPWPLDTLGGPARAGLQAALSFHDWLERMDKKGGAPAWLSARLRGLSHFTARAALKIISPEAYRGYLEGRSRKEVDLLAAEFASSARFDAEPVDLEGLKGTRVQIYTGGKDGTAKPAMNGRAAALFGLAPEDRKPLSETEDAPARPVEWWEDPDAGHLSYPKNPEKFLRRVH